MDSNTFIAYCRCNPDAAANLNLGVLQTVAQWFQFFQMKISTKSSSYKYEETDKTHVGEHIPCWWYTCVIGQIQQQSTAIRAK